MVNLANLIEKNIDLLAAVETLDNGKSLGMAKGDVSAVVGCLRYYGGWADKIEGKVIDTNPDTFSYTKQEPVSLSPSVQKDSFKLMILGGCLRSNHSLELPLAHVGMEDWPRCCHW